MTARSDARFTQMNTALKALADPTRLRILGLVAGGEVCVCHLHEALGVPQPTASRHLAYLRRAGLVEGRREGLWVYYRLAALSDDILRALVGAVTHCAGHVDTIVQDRKRLERATGCCCVVDSCPPRLACCAGPAPRGGEGPEGRRVMRASR
jgi:ArsR family transcriptional regulator, arsenate/arsenite/antimonite-responsive transcriptional repressor